MMFSEIRDTEAGPYSPMPFALAMPMMFYIYLALFEIPGITPPYWLWYFGLVYFLAGLMLRFVSTRLLWVRFYWFLGYSSVTVLVLSLSWFLLANGHGLGMKLVIGGMRCLFVVGNTIFEYRKGSKDPKNLGYGISGRLEEKTGQVFPRQATKSNLDFDEEAKKSRFSVSNVAPIAAGLSMFLVNVLSDNEVYWFLTLIALGQLWVGTVIVGGISYSVCWIHTWEREQEKQIVIER